MKFLIVFVLIAVVAVARAADADVKEHEKLVQENIKKCREKFPVTDDEFAQLKDGKVVEGTETSRCLVNCFMEEFGMIKNDKLDKEVAVKLLSVKIGQLKANEAVEKCDAEKGTIKCETALRYHNCFHGLGVY